APFSAAQAQFDAHVTPWIVRPCTVLSNQGPAEAPRCEAVPTPPRVRITELIWLGTWALPPASKFGAVPWMTENGRQLITIITPLTWKPPKSLLAQPSWAHRWPLPKGRS